MAKALQRNPFGEEEEPKRFAEFDVFTKLKVLVQLSQWTLINADRMREKMSENKDSEQTQWVGTLEPPYESSLTCLCTAYRRDWL